MSTTRTIEIDSTIAHYARTGGVTVDGVKWDFIPGRPGARPTGVLRNPDEGIVDIRQHASRYFANKRGFATLRAYIEGHSLRNK